MRIKENELGLVLLSVCDNTRTYSMCGVIFNVHSNLDGSGTDLSDVLFELTAQKLKENEPKAAQDSSVAVENYTKM